MARYVIDATTLVHAIGDELAIDPGHQLVAPNGIRTQALTLLLAAVRRGELSDAAALKQHERITEVRIRLLGDRVSRRTAWQLAREHDWPTLVDAEYLAVTRLQADALITIDPALAAKAAGVVPLAPLSALSTAAR